MSIPIAEDMNVQLENQGINIANIPPNLIDAIKNNNLIEFYLDNNLYFLDYFNNSYINFDNLGFRKLPKPPNSEKYSKYNVSVLNFENNLIEVLEDFDMRLDGLNLRGNPLKLIRKTFNIENLNLDRLVIDLGNPDLFFEDLETYTNWLYYYVPILNHSHVNLNTIPCQNNFNMYIYICPSLFELSLNKLDTERFKNKNKKDFDIYSSFKKNSNKIINQINECDGCSKYNILYEIYNNNDILIFKKNTYQNIYNKVVKCNYCYKCFNQAIKQ